MNQWPRHVIAAVGRAATHRELPDIKHGGIADSGVMNFC
jgi:hypothetical protein